MEQKDELYYIKRILDGDTECFSLFVDQYSHTLYILIVQIVGCNEDAEELLQDVFLKAFRHLKSYKGDCKFLTWLYRIAYNTAISATRKKKHEYLYIEENTINNVPDEAVNDFALIGDDKDQIELLKDAIEKLNEEEKAMITLFYYEDKSMEDIGEILGFTLSNTKTKLHRIRKKIYVLMNTK